MANRSFFCSYLSVFCALFAFGSSNVWGQGAARFDGHLVIRAQVASETDLETLLRESSDIWSERIGVGGTIDVRVMPESIPRIESAGIDYEVLIPDVQELIDSTPMGPAGAGWFDDYRTYGEVMVQLEVLEGLRPDLATVFEVGTSLEGRAIRGLRITGPGSDKPALYLQGCQHAREWIAVMVPMFIADALIQHYDQDPDIQALVDAVEFLVVPIVNPDGYVFSHEQNRLWRKNRRDNGDGTFGVDLNRNWSVDWGGIGSSADPSSQTYRGTAPFSEPETAAVRDFVLARPQVLAMVDIHSYSQLILEPWAYTADPHPDNAFYDLLCGGMAAEIFDVHAEAYRNGPGSTILYLASGVAPDWGIDRLGALGMTLELRDDGEYGFLLPAQQIQPTGEEILPAILHLAGTLTHPFAFTFPNHLPAVVPADSELSVPVQLHDVGASVLAPGFPRLLARVGNGGAFSESVLTPVGGIFEAVLPAAPCGSVVQYYLEAASPEGELSIAPEGAPAAVFESRSRQIDLVFVDDFENDRGWVTTGDATAGAWERGAPVGGGDRGDPPTDGDGSGQCFLTGNEDGDSDVDGGSARLTSPPLDALGGGEAHVSYRRWYSNAEGSNPEQDVFVVEISADDGESWVALETVGPEGLEVHGGWIFQSFRVADFVPPSDQMRVRFTASDFGPGSVVEAAVDDFDVVKLSCPGEPLFIRGDANADGVIDISDPVTVLEHLFHAGDVACQQSLDANDDETLNLSDGIDALAAIFGTGPVPAAPFPTCGSDPTAGSLSCDAFDVCF